MVAKSGKKKRKLNSKTVRKMLHWARNRFKQTLKFHGLKREATVIDVSEEYTSKTCTRCGHVYQNLGGSKHFKCPHCGHSMPRDGNGALGIFLKALRDTANVMVVPSRCYEGFSQLLAGIAGLDVFAYN